MAEEEIPKVSVIPLPAKVESREGNFVLPATASVKLPAGKQGELLAARLKEIPNQKWSVANQGAAAVEVVMHPPSVELGPEGYLLEISSKGIRVAAGTSSGLSYGMETLAQLIESAPVQGAGRSFQAMRIQDAPRFQWRGYMLDESRHFSGEEAVKRLLDAMARYKLNRFHWHLTDSAGWRIEIKKYPELTRVGGKGNETDPPEKAQAQFYTQEQIKRIVAYARERHIVVIPEIDMPGHADAAVLAYPQHGGGGMIQNHNPRKWPNFTFNPAKAETLSFLDDVLKEVAALFPDSPVIHFGGDEVHFGWKRWPELPEVQELMKKEGFKDLPEVEAWFNRRMADTIHKLGKKTAGWDEIAARQLPKDRTVIFWWRHDKPDVLRKALDAGYPVVLCPRRPLYFDFLQDGSHRKGRNWGGFNPLADVYRFPEGLGLKPEDASKVLGMQACLWTETALTQARRDFLTWPRLVAVAEASWTPQERKDYASFEERLKPELEWLTALGIKTWNPFTKPAEVTDQGAAVEYPDKPE